MVGKYSGYVSKDDLQNLKHYKYQGTDKSIMSKYVMQTYWTAVLKWFIPRTVAPNFLTLSGFFVVLAAFAAYCITTPNMSDPTPNWVWTFVGVAMFAYQTLDAIDGKQARRTQTSSPLGELFDHGCDSFITPLVALMGAALIGLTGWQAYLYTVIASGGFFFAVFEQFCTGTLELGYISGPTEGILILVALFLTGGYYGTQVFHTATVPFTNTTVAAGFVLFIQVAAVFTIGGNILHAVQLPRVAATAKTGFVSAMAPCLIGIACFTTLGYNFEFLMLEHTKTLSLCVGFVCVYHATRRTVERLCHKKGKVFTHTTLLSALALCVAPLIVREYFNDVVSADAVALNGTRMYCVFIIIKFAHLAWYICEDFALHLGVNVLTLTEKQLQNLKNLQ